MSASISAVANGELNHAAMEEKHTAADPVTTSGSNALSMCCVPTRSTSKTLAGVGHRRRDPGCMGQGAKGAELAYPLGQSGHGVGIGHVTGQADGALDGRYLQVDDHQVVGHAANRSTQRRPMPLAAPVTTATLTAPTPSQPSCQGDRPGVARRAPWWPT